MARNEGEWVSDGEISRSYGSGEPERVDIKLLTRVDILCILKFTDLTTAKKNYLNTGKARKFSDF